MEDFMEGSVAYLEVHMCGLCMHLLAPITIFEHILRGRTCGDISCNYQRHILLFHRVLTWYNDTLFKSYTDAILNITGRLFFYYFFLSILNVQNHFWANSSHL